MSADAETSRVGRDGVPMTPGREAGDDQGMSRALRELGLVRAGFVALAWLFVACLLVQVFLVGLDIFAKVSSSIHRDFAYTYGWLAPVLVLLSRTPQVPRETRIPALILLLLFATQTVLPSLRDQVPMLAALHPVNALAIFIVALTLARRASAAVAPTVATGIR